MDVAKRKRVAVTRKKHMPDDSCQNNTEKDAHSRCNKNETESSDSDLEVEQPAVMRKVSTHKQIKSKVSVKEGCLLLLISSSFQKWRRHYFKLRPRRLFYAKTKDAEIFEEVTLAECSVAERSTKNVNCSFSIITPFDTLILCAESRREMDEWISAIKAVLAGEFYEPQQFFMENFSGGHNWYTCTHARPTYCNVCREVLSGVMNHGLSCEVCKFKAHKRCAAKAVKHCKWAILSTVGKHIIENEDGVFIPHQWMEGNLPVSAKCVVCDKTCGSVLRLQDWRCLWCRAMVHTSCRSQLPQICCLGQCRMSIVPPTALSSMDSHGYWQAVPTGHSSSPLLVFVNSKSGDNQGVKFYRRFRQYLNPAQVFDLMCTGPRAGLRMFQKFEAFRILVCGGDGSIGWVLSEMDKMNLHKKAQVGVLPLGTGNDLAQVMGWGNVCDDDTQVPVILERYERASTKLLDRWSILTYERGINNDITQQKQGPISEYENAVSRHLSTILNSNRSAEVVKSAVVLCQTVKDLTLSVEAEDKKKNDSCQTLKEKLSSLLESLEYESEAAEQIALEGDADDWEAEQGTHLSPRPPKPTHSLSVIEDRTGAKDKVCTKGYGSCDNLLSVDDLSAIREINENLVAEFKLGEPVRDSPTRKNIRPSKERTGFQRRKNLWLRADSLKKAVRKIIEETEKVIDEQNEQTLRNKLQAQSVEEDAPTKVPVSFTDSNESSTLQTSESFSSKSSTVLSTASNNLELPSHSQRSSIVSNTENATLSLPVANFPKLSPKVKVKGLSDDAKQEGSRSFVRPSEERGCSHVNPDFMAGGSVIGRVLLANTDALCAAATPLMNFSCPIMNEMFTEKCVMNNYFGIGLDAKIALDFHRKREEHPKKCSRTKNMMWYGMLATREFALKTYKNLGQRIRLECDGQHIPLPRLQGIVVLNIPSFMGGSNFWGGKTGNNTFMAPSYNDKVLEVVAVYGTMQLGMAMVVPEGVLQSHRIAQCRSITITILGEEGVPLQVDGEAWLQPPGVIKIEHKNRAQMLSRDRHFEETLKSWEDKHPRGLDRTLSTEYLTESELDAAGELATRMYELSIKIDAVVKDSGANELLSCIQTVQRIGEKVRPDTRVTESVSRSLVSDLVAAVADLSSMMNKSVQSQSEESCDLSQQFEEWLGDMEMQMKKVADIKWLASIMTPTPVEEISAKENTVTMTAHKNKFRIGPFSRKNHKKDHRVINMDYNVNNWCVNEVGQWLEFIQLGEYKEVFSTHEIRGEELLKLESSDMKGMGITKVGHIKRIQSGIKELQKAMNRCGR